jgi:hypothetical protein
MAIPNSAYTEIISTTLANYRDRMSDNVLAHNPLLTRLKKKGNTDAASGGTELLENLQYSENSTFQWYSGYETLDVSASDVLTSANFAWKQANCNVTISGLEMLKNASDERVFNLIETRIKVAEKTMMNKIADSLFFSNTENGGKSIGGLQHLVADLPTSGTVGGIDSDPQTWWRNQYYSFQAESGPPTPSASTITHAMNLIYLRTLRGADAVDFIVAGENYFTYYEESLQANQRFTKAETGDGGFVSYKYKGADVFYDGNCSSSRMYFLNTDYLHYRPHSERNFTTDDRKAAVNQDAVVVPLYFAGNLTVSNRSLQGVIIA